MKKSLGQHLLVNRDAALRIIGALDIRPEETVIEIGPGKEALTSSLAGKMGAGATLILIEKDDNFAAALSDKYSNARHIRVIHGDALQEIPNCIKDLPGSTPFKIIGNIPYYITGKLLRIIGELGRQPAMTVLMIQKEVAERVSAQPPGMNLLAAAVQYWAEARLLFILKPDNFSPPPAVDSAVIALVPKSAKTMEDGSRYYRFLHILFKQPRKTVANNISDGLELPKNEVERRLKEANLDLNCRPHDLSLQQIAGLSNLFTA